jgi:hypothetical protein
MERNDAGGLVTLSPMKLSYDLGETVTLTATPLPHQEDGYDNPGSGAVRP